MRIWFDCEFVDTGSRIILISIGLVREDDKTFYAELETPETLRHESVSQWVIDNVYPQLVGTPEVWRSGVVVAEAIKQLAGPEPEFWGYRAAYPWVGLSQLYVRLGVFRPTDWLASVRDAWQLPDFHRYRVPASKPDNALFNALALKVSFLRWEHARTQPKTES